jgi:DNA-binding CsgD family transcriptional regulator
VTPDARERAVAKIAELSGRCRDLATFWGDSTQVLAEVVDCLSPCWFTLDPASLLVTSHVNPDMPDLPRDFLANEYYGEDVNQMSTVARSASGISTLHDATGGKPSVSPRWHAIMALGAEQEMIARLRTRSGDVWGTLGLYRHPDRPLFSQADKDFVKSVAPHLAAGARRALLFGEATDHEGPDDPGLVILTSRWQIESATPGVEKWLAELPDADERLPSSLVTVAARALRNSEHPDAPNELAVARVLSRSGTWIVLHAACLDPVESRRIAVIIEPAHPARIAPLLMSAYGLSERERDVTRLILQGCSTTQIANDLVVSTHTVQQHLKSIFDKTGVRSRRDLVGRIFFAHYEPRLRDNEYRLTVNKPLHGGPATAPGAPKETALR